MKDKPDSGVLVAVETATVPSTAVGGLLNSIRPHWRARSLIERVEKLLPVDASSACQRLLNAAFHDLREKVCLAGIDIAQQAATLHKLPSIVKAEDVESYSNSRIIDLSYRMGLLTRAEWRRLKRCYEIRRDLEHEDDEYEAELEDCVYIFKTCIEVVLSRDPVELLRVSDVKEVIENPKPQFPEQQFLDDYSGAPEPRQLEIQRFLVSTSLDPDRPDIVRCNAVEMLKHLASDTKNPVKIDVAHDLHKRIGRGVPDIAIFKVAHAAGVAPYLKKNKRNDYFSDVFKRLRSAEHVWKKHAEHGDLLAELEDVGGLEYCECDETGRKILGWLILCYVGEPGGYGDWGRRRAVFFSDTAAPIIQRIIQRSGEREVRLLKEAAKFKTVKRALAQGKSIAQRFEDLLDLAGDV